MFSVCVSPWMNGSHCKTDSMQNVLNKGHFFFLYYIPISTLQNAGTMMIISMPFTHQSDEVLTLMKNLRCQ
ncbi:hypothetical protein FKM82_006066 [Ascaphus truei]